jgi:DNA-binding NtrC family response regulator
VIERLVILTGSGTIAAEQVREQLQARVRSPGHARREVPSDDPAGTRPSAVSSAPPQTPTDSGVIALAAARQATERETVERAVRQARGNRTRAAKLLGVSRRTLYTKLLELGLDEV